MDSYYRLLDISEQATPDEIEAAYQRLIQDASPGQDADSRPSAEIERAYQALIDPEQRRAYDTRLAAQRHGARTGITRRELLMSVGGAVVGLLLIAVVWSLAGRNAAPALPPVAEMSRPAPDFALPGLDGGTIRLSDYRGKVVLVNFWGTWCEPCKEETPALQAVYSELRGQGLEIIGVNLYSQETGGDSGVRAFLTPYGVTYPIALDIAGETAQAFQISPIPASYFVDPSGTIRFVKVGTLTSSEVRALFERLQPRAEAAP